MIRKLMIGLILFSLSVTSYADLDQENVGKKIILTFLVKNDFNAWLNNGKSLFDWSSLAAKDKLISQNSVTPPILYQAFNMNVFSAEDQYSKIPQIIDGVVYKVGKDSLGQPFVSFLTQSYIDNFITKGFDKDEIINFTRTSRVKIVCYQFNFNDVVLSSNQCTTYGQYLDQVSGRFASDLVGNIDSFNVSKLKADDKTRDVITRVFEAIEKASLVELAKECGNTDFIGPTDCEKSALNLFRQKSESFSTKNKAP